MRWLFIVRRLFTERRGFAFGWKHIEKPEPFHEIIREVPQVRRDPEGVTTVAPGHGQTLTPLPCDDGTVGVIAQTHEVPGFDRPGNSTDRTVNSVRGPDENGSVAMSKGLRPLREAGCEAYEILNHFRPREGVWRLVVHGRAFMGQSILMPDAMTVRRPFRSPVTITVRPSTPNGV